MNRQQQVEKIAAFCNDPEIFTTKLGTFRRLIGPFDPFTSDSDAALVRRAVEQRGWKWEWWTRPMSYGCSVFAQLKPCSVSAETEYAAFNEALLAALEQEERG